MATQIEEETRTQIGQIGKTEKRIGYQIRKPISIFRENRKSNAEKRNMRKLQWTPKPKNRSFLVKKLKNRSKNSQNRKIENLNAPLLKEGDFKATLSRKDAKNIFICWCLFRSARKQSISIRFSQFEVGHIYIFFDKYCEMAVHLETNYCCPWYRIFKATVYWNYWNVAWIYFKFTLHWLGLKGFHYRVGQM